MVACVKELRWGEEKGQGVLEFKLGKGVYATTMLRELSGGCWRVCWLIHMISEVVVEVFMN